MKNRWITWIAAAFLAGCSGQKVAVSDLPKPVVKEFALQYPDIAGVQWNKETHKGKVIYAGAWKKDGKRTEVEFDANGRFLREE